MPNNEDAKSAAALLRMNYQAINVVIDGVSVRHQVSCTCLLRNSASWFSSVGGYSMLEGYGHGVYPCRGGYLKVFQDSLLPDRVENWATELAL